MSDFENLKAYQNQNVLKINKRETERGGQGKIPKNFRLKFYRCLSVLGLRAFLLGFKVRARIISGAPKGLPEGPKSDENGLRRSSLYSNADRTDCLAISSRVSIEFHHAVKGRTLLKPWFLRGFTHVFIKSTR